MKKALASSSLLTSPPDSTESALIHRIWHLQLDYHDPHNPARLPSNARYMSSTSLRTASIMQPQFRNRHQFQVFGGFLLKQTFELAFCCAASFAHARPTFISADPCTFLNPVPVGSVLYLTATVAYTDPPISADHEGEAGHAPEAEQDGKPFTRISVRVDSKVRDVEHGHAKSTGQFHYTFTVEKDIRVVPQSYQENMIYIDGRRRSKRVDDVVGTRAQEKSQMSSVKTRLTE